MFEFVRTHTKLLQFVLVLLIFPSFVFFGRTFSAFSQGTDSQAQLLPMIGNMVREPAW